MTDQPAAPDDTPEYSDFYPSSSPNGLTADEQDEYAQFYPTPSRTEETR